MPRKPRPTPTPIENELKPMVSFEFERRTYQIDPGLRKVYRRFVEIETAKAAEIFSLWRAGEARA
jgi:hypothetical protein